MDLFTQGLLGAAVAQRGARNHEIRLATLIGFVAGLVADADILIRSSSDPFLTIEYHRHFTHSIFFIPIGSLLATLLLLPLFYKRLGVGRLLYFCFLGYLLSGTLDLFTSYGTYWLWPLLDERLALHFIGIVDIVFTPVLLLFVVIACWKKRASFAGVGLIFCACYLFLGYVQLQRATAIAEELAVSRGHEPQRLLVKPSPLTLFLWRSIYQDDDRYFIDAIHVSWKKRIYEGDSVSLYQRENSPLEIAPDSMAANDIRRFEKFSDGYIASSPDNDFLIGDMRYALLPNSIEPLWGIEINPYRLNHHATYAFYRRNNSAERRMFLQMILGWDID